MLRSIILLLLLGGASLQLAAHALWIETQSSGKSGQAQTVKVFYGEPAAGTPDKVADWWSDVSSFELWLIKPDGSKEQLEVAAQDDHFTASFTPSDEGLYTLSVSHSVADVSGGTQYQFNATALVSVGEAAGSTDYAAGAADLYLYADPAARFRKGKPVAVSCHAESGPVSEAYLTAFAPSGWSKSLQTDGSGAASFVPEWSGTYLIEAGKGEEVSGESYKSVYRIATLRVNVPK